MYTVTFVVMGSSPVGDNDYYQGGIQGVFLAGRASEAVERASEAFNEGSKAAECLIRGS